MKLWDYKLLKHWTPKTPEDWIWYLERKINYDDWQGLKPKIIKKYFAKLKIDSGKRLIIHEFFKRYGT